MIEVGLGHCLLQKCFWSPTCILLTELHQLAIIDDVTSLFDHMIPKYLTSVHVRLAADVLAADVLALLPCL